MSPTSEDYQPLCDGIVVCVNASLHPGIRHPHYVHVPREDTMSNFPPNPTADSHRSVRMRRMWLRLPPRKSINQACMWGAVIAAILAACLITLFANAPVHSTGSIGAVLTASTRPTGHTVGPLTNQLLTGVLLQIWQFLAALPHHGYLFRALSRILRHLGDI